MAWFQRLLFVAALGLVIGLPFALRPADEAPVAAGKRVIVLTPHNEFIRHEVGLAFRGWHQKHFGESVEVDWRKMDGSSTILRLLTAQYEALAAEGKEEEGAGYDIVFGGGDYLFDVELKRGVTVIDAKGETRKVSITQPITLDPALVQDCYRGEEIAGRRLYDADGHWWGVVLSSFGIVYNRDVLALRDLPEPQTWSDMAAPGYYNWVALADPVALRLHPRDV